MRYRFILFLVSFFSLTSCDNTLECILGLEPEINESSISDATVNQRYFQRITAEVNNTPNDNNYN